MNEKEFIKYYKIIQKYLKNNSVKDATNKAYEEYKNLIQWNFLCKTIPLFCKK